MTGSTRMALGAMAGSALGILTVLLPRSGQALQDRFHHGELFTASVSLTHGHPAGWPITIHGAIDYVPALLARALFGSDHYLFMTWLGVTLIDAITVVSVAAVLMHLVAEAHRTTVELMLAGLAVAWTVTARDLFLIPILWLFIARNQVTRAALARWTPVLLGILVACGVVWCWNRGTIGLAAISIGYALELRRRRWEPLAYLGATVATFALFSVTTGLFSPRQIADNLWVLMRSGANWRLPADGEVVMLAVAMAAFEVVALTGLVCAVRQRRLDPTSATVWGLMCVGLAKSATDRLDLPHVLQSLWLPFVAILFVLPDLRRLPRGARTATVVCGSIGCLLLVIVGLNHGSLGPMMIAGCAAAWSLHAPAQPRRPLNVLAWAAGCTAMLLAAAYVAGSAYSGRYAWVKGVVHPPATAAMVPKDVRSAGDTILRSGSGCVLDMSNSGLVNAYTDLPTCTRYGYLVYAPAERQREMRSEIERTDPKAVILSSDWWHFAIDGKSMTSRYPELSTWLQRRYPVVDCNDHYCVGLASDAAAAGAGTR